MMKNIKNGINKKGSHSAYTFLILFVAIISIFVTASVLKGDTGIPTGLVVDDNMQKQLDADQEANEAQKENCDYEKWFQRFTCKIGIYDWFYHEADVITVYTLDSDGNVVDASIISDEVTAKGDVSIQADN